MGKLAKGILGSVYGKVGTVIGSRWKNTDYIRSLSKPVKTSSPGQLSQRAKFLMVTRFLNAINDVVKITFNDPKSGVTGRNNATAHVLKSAVVGDYPDLGLDYTQALISKGNLPNALTPHASIQAGKIRFEWLNNAGVGKAKPTDKAILALYCEELNHALYTIQGPTRNALVGELGDPVFSGRSVQTWLAFISSDGKEVSPSVHLGQFLMP